MLEIEDIVFSLSDSSLEFFEPVWCLGVVFALRIASAAVARCIAPVLAAALAVLRGLGLKGLL
jgi:hypothetical protein